MENNINRFFLNLSSFLIILIPIFLITGPLLTDASIVIIDIIFLYFLFRYKKFDLLNNIYFKYLIMFSLIITIRSIFVDEFLFSIKSSGLYFRFIIFIFALSFFLQENKYLIKRFSVIFFITISFVIIDAYIQFFMGKNLFGYTNTNIMKLHGIFDDRGVLGSYLIRLLPLFFALFINLFEIKQNKNLLIFSLFSILFIIFASGSRSSFYLSLLFMSLVLVFLKYLRKRIIILLVTFTIILSIASSFNKRLNNAIYYSFIDPIQGIFHNKEKDMNLNKLSILGKEFYMFTHIYHAHYSTGLKMFNDNRLFGQGNKMFRKLCSEKKFVTNYQSCATHPHNFYIQLLAENGIVGFLLIFNIFIIISYILIKEAINRNFKKIQNYKDTSLFILIGIFINLWPIIPSGNFFNNWLSALIFFPIGFYFYFMNMEKNA